MARASDEREIVPLAVTTEVAKVRGRIVVARGVAAMDEEERRVEEAESKEEAAELWKTTEVLRMLREHAKEGEDAKAALERLIYERTVLAGVCIDAWDTHKGALSRVVRTRPVTGERVVVVPKRVPT